MHHINHYKEARKIFKIDYDSHMIIVTVCSNSLYKVLNPSFVKNYKNGLEWNEMFPLMKQQKLDKVKKFKKKLSIFSVSRILGIPKESVRRKINILCKKKYLNYSIKGGLSLAENFVLKGKKLASKDLASLIKVIRSVDKYGLEKLNKFKNSV
jgi:hypothetical protein|tara:strand:+ start:132 stop:590 length:459 start_codon:yes stop_codon:yes gene_type:complete